MKKFCKIQTMLSALFILVIVSQGCSVYRKPVSVENAVDKGPVKVFLKDNRSIKFNNLILDNGNILGKTGNMLKIKYETLHSRDIRYVKLKNRSLSTILTFVLIGGVVAIPVIAVISIHETSRNPWVISGGFN